MNDEGDIYGDGVNIAARIESLAEPGMVYLSDTAYQQIRGKLSLEIADMGERPLKNIAHPVRGYGVRVDRAASTLALPDKPSIAVLPFTNMSGDSEQEHFADGMTDDIITSITQIHCICAIKRNSNVL